MTQYGAGRTDPDGRLVLLAGGLRAGPPGRFLLQAAIAALHAQAPTYDATDWPQILTLYDELVLVWSSPVVALNRAVAVAMVDGPQAGLAVIAELERDGRLDGYRYLASTKADLLRRLGRDAEAAAAYRAAIALTDNAAERAYLEEQLARVTPAGGRSPTATPPRRSAADATPPPAR